MVLRRSMLKKNYTLVGVISFGSKEKTTNLTRFSIMSDVATYIDFIVNNSK